MAEQSEDKMRAELLGRCREAQKKLDEVKKLAIANDKKIDKVDSMLKGLKPPTFRLADLTKQYNTAVRKSDGLTSVKPSCVKALQNAEKKPDPTILKAAIKSVSDHRADVQKTSKKDKSKTKAVAAFSTALDGIIKSLKEYESKDRALAESLGKLKGDFAKLAKRSEQLEKSSKQIKF